MSTMTESRNENENENETYKPEKKTTREEIQELRHALELPTATQAGVDATQVATTAGAQTTQQRLTQARGRRSSVVVPASSLASSSHSRSSRRLGSPRSKISAN